MAKHMTQLDNTPQKGQDNDFDKVNPAQPTEPLSGSKTVKNRQHTRTNQGEGS